MSLYVGAVAYALGALFYMAFVWPQLSKTGAALWLRVLGMLIAAPFWLPIFVVATGLAVGQGIASLPDEDAKMGKR